MLLLLIRAMWRWSLSLLHLVSTFWLSGHLFFVVQFISEFIWVNVRWKGPTCQAKIIMSCFAMKRDVRKCTWSEHSAREPISVSRLPTCDQSASQECGFATPTKRKKSPYLSRVLGPVRLMWKLEVGVEGEGVERGAIVSVSVKEKEWIV